MLFQTQISYIYGVRSYHFICYLIIAPCYFNRYLVTYILSFAI